MAWTHYRDADRLSALRLDIAKDIMNETVMPETVGVWLLAAGADDSNFAARELFYCLRNPFLLSRVLRVPPSLPQKIVIDAFTTQIARWFVTPDYTTMIADAVRSALEKVDFSSPARVHFLRQLHFKLRMSGYGEAAIQFYNSLVPTYDQSIDEWPQAPAIPMSSSVYEAMRESSIEHRIWETVPLPNTRDPKVEFHLKELAALWPLRI